MSAASVPTVKLKQGSAKPIHAGHPWIFADAIASIDGPRPEPGDEVRVLDERGTCVGRGFISPDSAIPVRLLTRADDAIGDAFFAARIDEALQLRRDILGLGKRETATAYRLINSEGDGLGGLTVDVYGEYLSVQIGTVGMYRRRNAILDVLESRLKPRGILDRSDKRARSLEKLAPADDAPLRGAAPVEREYAREHGVEIAFDLRAGHGQKTGLYLDQRENRLHFATFAREKHVLDVFSYCGAFSLHAAKAGAKSITLIESSAEALEGAQVNFARNGVDDADLINAEWTEGFRHLRETGKRFDVVAVDPPKFARSKANVPQALSAYRDLNAQAARLMNAGGLLFTFSCSGNVSEQEFERAVASGIRSTGRRAVLIDRRGPAMDHPVPPGFDQGRYLKCLVLQVMN